MFNCRSDFGQIQWRFAVDSFRVFDQLQNKFDSNALKSTAANNSIDRKSTLRLFSRKFRKIVLEKLASELKVVVSSLENEGLPSDQVAQLDCFLDRLYSIEQFWHLCELYLMGNVDNLLPEALSWLKVSTLCI